MCLTAAPLDGFVGIELPDFGEWFAGKASAADELAATGQCGDDVYWSFDSATGELVISGTGEMWDYTSSFGAGSPFAWTTNIKNVTIENGVTDIGSHCFWCCEGMESITIPDSVTSIDSSAFYSCKMLSNILIPNSVTSISYGAFSYCDSLIDIFIPESVVSIGNEAFSGNKLLNINVDDNNQHFCSVDGVLFNKNKSILIRRPNGKTDLSYTIPNGIVSIYNGAFSSNKFQKVIIPESMTKIEDDAFSGCKNLSVIVLPPNLMSIGCSAFSWCYALKEITIPDSVTTIGESIFYSCRNLESVTLGKGLKTISKSAFSSCESLSEITIPSNITTIGVWAFMGCYALTNIIIPGSVKVINDCAFQRCTNLKDVIISNGVVEMLGSVFAQCNSLNSITIPESVKIIGDSVTNGCNNLLEIVVDENNANYCSVDGVLFDKTGKILVQYPGGKAETYKIPDGTVTIKEGAFRGLMNPTSLTMPNSIIKIGFGAFEYRNTLTDIYYNGTETQWNNINISGCNDDLLDATIHFFDDDHTHIEEEIPAVEATCTTSGSTSGIKCSVCNEIIVAPEEIPSLHMANGTIYREPTCTVEGKVGGFCTVCKQTFIETIPAIGHIDDNSDDICDVCSESVNSGQCGYDAYWNFDKNTGVLTISGTGEMWSYSLGASPFYMLDIKSVTIENGVTSIGGYAFYGCDGIVEIQVSDSITEIGWSAFESCTSLKSITIPDGVTIINHDAFRECHSLESVKLPKGITRIDGTAFYNCYKLTDITIPDTVTFFGDFSFAGCTSLKNINIPDGVESINYCAFMGCTVLENVTIPDGVTSIGDYAFWGCQGFTDILIPDGVISLGASSFAECVNLKEITIPDSVTSIGNYAFSGCSVLADNGDVYFGGTKEQWDSIDIYDGNDPLLNATIHFLGDDADDVVTGQCGDDTYWSLNKSTGVLTITGTGAMWDYDSNESPFDDIEEIKSVVIEDGITTIGKKAFSYCLNLTSVDIPDGVVSIEEEAFMFCPKLASIYIPASVTYIGKSAFAVCGKLESITVDVDNTSYSSDSLGVLFDKDKILLIQYPIGNANTSYTIPDGVETIGYLAFGLSYYLVSVDMPDSVTVIDDAAFHYCGHLKEINFSSNLKSIGDSAFYLCWSLESLNLPDSLESIGGWAFYMADRIEKINVPKNLKVDIRYLFSGYGSFYLKEIVIPAEVEAFEFDLSDNYLCAIGLESVVNYSPVAVMDQTFMITCDSVEIAEIYAYLAHSFIKVDELIPNTCDMLCIDCMPEIRSIFRETIELVNNKFGANYDFDDYNPSDVSSAYDNYERLYTNIIENYLMEHIKEDASYPDYYSISCLEESAQHKYCRENKITHKIIDGEDKLCNCAGEDECAHVVETFLPVAPTCTETGLTQGLYCSKCGKVFEKQVEVPAPGHTWSEWKVVQEATIVQQGKKTRTCSACRETETELIDRLEIDWENDDNYGKANFTVVDAKTLDPINNAWINIFTEDGETSTYVTDSQGKVSIVLPVGEVKFAAGAEGKRIRNLKYNITHAEIDVPTIALSSDPLIDAEFTKKDMTREEIIDAGINVEDPDNTHVVEYTVTIEYEGEKRVIAYCEDDDGNRYYPGDEPDTPGGGYIIGGNTVYLTEKFYLIIKGQVSWLKQMFEVEMRVYNNSPFDTFEDAQATLILPDGLSLASMVDGDQTLTQNLGTVAENSQTSCKWYVRGDKAGTYSISANLKGVLMPFEEEFNHTYVAEDPIVVYDENAIKLYVKAPAKVECGKEFSVIIGVENISDITLYNMSHVFTDLSECFVRHYSNGEIIAEFYAYDPIGMGKFAEEFNPGDKLELEYKSSILLNSENIKNTIFNLVDIVIDAGDVKTEINNNFGYHDEHSMGEYTVTKPATCTETGTQVAKCEYCGYEKIEEIPAKGHIDNDMDEYCDVCGVLLSDSDNACDLYGHDYQWITKTAATCTEDGEEIYICQREACGDVNDSRVISALGHDPFEYGVPATCTVNGYKFITCARCYAELDYITLEKTGHISGTYIKDKKEATCTEDGYTGDVCCVSCNMKLESGTIIEKLGHDAVVHTQNALCTTNGFTITVCARCYDLLDYIIINRLGHDMGTPISNDDGTHTSKCQRSGCEYSETDDCTYEEWEIITESTCVVAGEKSRACTECGYAETEELPLADHIPGEVVVENNIDPECEEMGQYDNVVYCTVCNEELSRETIKVDSLGHDWDDGEIIKAASCTVKEETVYTCKRNSAHVRIEVGDVDPDNHIGGRYIDNQKDATCTEEGYSGDTYCSDCKIKLASGTVIDKLQHNPIEYEQAESCVTNGYKITICSLCYELLGYETFIKLGHNMGDFESNDDGTHTSECQRDICTYAETYDCTFGEWVTTLESTCTAEGEKSRICTVCGYAETETLPLTEHIPGTVVVENNVAPKCEEEGSYDNVVYCIVCNEELSRETVVVNKLGHNWDNGSITKVATCIASEEILYTCLNDASHTRTEVGNINPDNHTNNSYYVDKMDATCTEAGFTGDTYCSDCQQKVSSGVVIDMLGHDMGEWVTVKEATLLEEGKSEKYCSRCTYTETQSIPRKTGKSSEDSDSGVTVEYPEDAYDDDITVNVKEEFDGSQFLAQQYTNIIAWNIKTYIDGVEAQPNVPVLVKIPLPASFDGSEVAVFHINSNTGVREKIEPVIVRDGYISFMANSFSVYIMVDESSEIHNHKDDNHDGICDGCDHDFTSGCSCRCHKTGIIARVIWKFMTILNKLLRRNQICSCGIYHY